ncbi:MAG TPA: preprotein translocase subunit SecE [Woeseiaceae bacterium]|nr:preprotein translocase subunit SecE [Woeseiaceae bacterium]
MATHTETNQGSALDTVKLVVSALMLLGGLYGYYYFENTVALPLRVLMVLAGTGAGIGIAMISTQGQRLWHFIQGSRVEIRKVVWPTRQETTQTAIAVFVFTLIMALFFWALDAGLLWLTQTLVG